MCLIIFILKMKNYRETASILLKMGQFIDSVDTFSFWVLSRQKTMRGCELNFWLEYKITNFLGVLSNLAFIPLITE